MIKNKIFFIRQKELCCFYFLNVRHLSIVSEKKRKHLKKIKQNVQSESSINLATRKSFSLKRIINVLIGEKKHLPTMNRTHGCVVSLLSCLEPASNKTLRL